MHNILRMAKALGASVVPMFLLMTPALAAPTSTNSGASDTVVAVCVDTTAGDTTAALVQGGDERAIRCILTGTINFRTREICLTGISCEGGGVTVQAKFSEPLCFTFE